jgi:hypothetical protein
MQSPMIVELCDKIGGKEHVENRQVKQLSLSTPLLALSQVGDLISLSATADGEILSLHLFDKAGRSND